MTRVQMTWGAIWTAAALISFAPDSSRAEESEVPNRGRLRKLFDPAQALLNDSLTKGESTRLRAWFNLLSSDNFEEAQRARSEILKYGPRAAPMARQYENHEDTDTRLFARSFPQYLILQYHGYLPVAPELKAALAAPRRMFIGKQESFRGALERFIRDSQLSAAFSWKNCPDRIIGTHETIELNLPAGKALDTLLQYVGMTAVPRGSGIAGVLSDQAPAMTMQEHDFPAPSLAVAQRRQLAELLGKWLPPESHVTEIENGIHVNGSESTLRLAARAIYFLAPEGLEMPAFEGSSGIFPNNPDPYAVRALFEALETPVAEFAMAGIEPLRGVARLRAAGHALEIEESAPELVPLQPAVSLDLRGVPLGLTLRWLKLRANAPEPNSGARGVSLELEASLGQANQYGKPRIIARLLPAETIRDFSETTGYSDASFLYTGEFAKLEVGDVAVSARIQDRFADELTLFPCAENDFELFVFNRRVIARGPPALVARLNEFIQSWRETGTPPQTKWRQDLNELLKRKVDWDGRDLTVKTLLPRLREVTRINVLLERPHTPDSNFEIDGRDMALLPPGKYTAQELLERLAEVFKKRADLRGGVIVLSFGGKFFKAPLKIRE